MAKVKKDLAQLGKQMMLLGTYEEYDVNEIIEVLKAADDLYHNDQQSFLDDSEYDALRKFAEMNDPSHAYFAGVGSDVRGGKVKLPREMGSLDQVEIGEIDKWVTDNNLSGHIVIATDKLDGTSGMVIYDTNGDMQIAFSRGNGTEGADITRHIRRFKSIPKTISTSRMVRGEIILSKSDFLILRDKVMSRGGTPYKNARNMVAGLMNAEKNDPIVYDYLHFVAYGIYDYDNHKHLMLADLRDDGFMVPATNFFMGKDLTDNALADYLNERRAKSDYEIDGLVLDVDQALKRQEMNPTRDTLNPAYAVKYKVADASNIAITEVVAVHWAPSKHGYLKPRVEIQPVELVGVTVTFATGFNAKFIVDNGIGPGAEVQITRSGDVIPYIQKTVKKATPQMPSTKYDWITNDDGTQVDIILEGHESNVEVRINRLTDFFTTIDAPQIRKGAIQKLYDAGYKTIEDIIKMSEIDMVRVLGANGSKVYSGLRTALTDIPAYKFIGAHSNVRGLGVRKFKKLQQALGVPKLLACTNHLDIINIAGFDEKTARGAVKAIAAFVDFAANLSSYYSFGSSDAANTGSLAGQKVVFTGFRDKNLEQIVEDEGGEMQSAVSNKTTIVVALTPNSSSGKIKKARDLGIRIMGVDEFKRMVE